MNIESIHSHDYEVNRDSHERKTFYVIIITLITMAVEIITGFVTGSMALLADGWHMGTHAAALCVTLFALSYSRKHSNDPRFSFGTGKVSILGGYTSAVFLGITAIIMAYESVERLIKPVEIDFKDAILVAVIGLVVNLVCAWLLHSSGGHHHHHDHSHHDHDHDHGSHEDHSVKAAYLHVIADALTSVLAILALIAGYFAGWKFLDPLMGIVGACVIGKWSYNLLVDSGFILLDATTEAGLKDKIKAGIATKVDGKIADFHLWQVANNVYSASIIVYVDKLINPQELHEYLLEIHGLEHVTVEVREKVS